MDTKRKITIEVEDIELLVGALRDSEDIQLGVLDMLIDSDQTPETVDEFMAVVSDQQDLIGAIQKLRTTIQGLK